MRRLTAAVVLGLLTLTLGLSACHHEPTMEELARAAEVQTSFLADNAKAPGVVTLPSGLQYKNVKSGPADGPSPAPGDDVKVNYEGKLTDGKVFDSSFQRGEPADFTLAHLIPGWIEALQLMRPGDEWMLYVPPRLGYGDEGAGPIPPNSVLIFRIQLLATAHHPAPNA